MIDRMTLLDALSEALGRFFTREAPRLPAEGSLVPWDHRFAVCLESSLRSTLLGTGLRVDLRLGPGNPSLVVNDSGDQEPRILALRTARFLLGPRDKATLDHWARQDYEEAFGLCYKPGKDYFLWYIPTEQGLVLRRIRKDAPGAARLSAPQSPGV